jgi:hypothetical protein
LILLYSSLNNLPELFRALKFTFRVIKLSRGRFVHPFLIAGEVDDVLAFFGRDLVVEAMLSPIKDSDMTVAGLLPGRICIDSMTRWCLVGETFGLFVPDIAFNL